MTDDRRRRVRLDPALAERAAAMVRRMRRGLRRVRARVGRLAEEMAVRLAERSAGMSWDRGSKQGVGGDSMKGRDEMATKRDRKKGDVVSSGAGDGGKRKRSTSPGAAPPAKGPEPSRMVSEGGPVHSSDVAAAEGEAPEPETRTAPPGRAAEAAKSARRMVSEGGPVHEEASEATVGEDQGGGEADESAEADVDVEDPPFPLRAHLHTWLYGSSAPAAIELLPVEPRRAWAWWRLDEAQRNALRGVDLYLEILDAAGHRVELHRIEGPEGEWFLSFGHWRPRLSARVGTLEDGTVKPVLSTGPIDMPSERAGDAPVRWTDTARRSAVVRGIPAEYAGGEIPVIVAEDGTLLRVGVEALAGEMPTSAALRMLRPGPVSGPPPPSSSSGRPVAGDAGDAGA